MDQKLMVNFEAKKNDRDYLFSVQMGSPFADCLEILDEYKAAIIEMARLSDEQAKALEEEKQANQEPVAELVNQ